MNYQELLQSFPPKPIDNDEQYKATEAIVKSFIGKKDKTLDEKLYIEVLVTLLFAYYKQQKVLDFMQFYFWKLFDDDDWR